MSTPAQGSSAAAIYLALVSIGCVCALLIVTTYLLTRPVIAQKRSALMRQAVISVLPGSRSSIALRTDDTGQLQPAAQADEAELFLAQDAQGRMTGVAISGSGMGYQDTIGLLYGYEPQTGQIRGLRVLDSRETPGLGDRIMRDPDFLAAFAALPVPLTPDGQRLQQPVELAAAGRPRQPWQIDGITGATISSRAVARIIAESSAYWIPVIQRQQQALQEIASP